jgi:hypothetical protein
MQAQELGERLAQVRPLDHRVHEAVLELELGALEPLGQLGADGLLDDARPRKADERLGLGENYVSE